MNAITINLPIEDSSTLGASIYWLLALTGKCPTAHGTAHGTAIFNIERALSAEALSRLAEEVGATVVAQLDHGAREARARSATGEAAWPDTFFTLSLQSNTLQGQIVKRHCED